MRAVRLGLVAFFTLSAAIAVLGAIYHPYPEDFGLFRDVGLGALAGAPYDASATRTSNAPTFALLPHIVWALAPEINRAQWALLMLAGYLACVGLMEYAHPRGIVWITWALALPTLMRCLMLGQVYPPLALPVAVAVYFSKNTPILAGAMVGMLVAMKPNFAPWLALLFAAGQYRLALPALGWTAGFAALPAVLYGTDVYLQWWGSARDFGLPQMLRAGSYSLPSILSWSGISWLPTVGTAAFLLGLALWTWRRRPNLDTVNSVGMVASLLAAPYSYITTVPMIVPLLYGSQPCSPRWWAAALIVLPQVFGSANPNALPIVSGLAVWLLLVATMREHQRMTSLKARLAR